MNVKIMKTDSRASLPVYATSGAAAADIRIILDEPVVMQPGDTYRARTGLAMELPDGYVALICARSGLASKKGICLANGVGVIDSDYRGELQITLHNSSRLAFELENNMRVAQLMIMPVLRAEFECVDSIGETERGVGGFGSTGIE